MGSYKETSGHAERQECYSGCDETNVDWLPQARLWTLEILQADPESTEDDEQYSNCECHHSH
ncbi:MAG: hypothetical protein ACYSTZ_08380 [Planctomycetota bacterium]|jgi:hypothetical protein